MSKMKSVTTPKPPSGYCQPGRGFLYTLKSAVEIAVGTEMGMYLARVTDELPESDRLLSQYQLFTLQNWVQTGMRCVYPSRELIESCRRTNLLRDIEGKDIHRIHPTLAFWMPEPAPFACDGQAVQIVTASVGEGSTMSVQYPNRIIALHMPRRRYAQFHLWCVSNYCFSFVIPLSESGSVAEVVEKYAGVPVGPEVTIGDAERESSIEVVETVLNLMMLMQSYPQYLQRHVSKARFPGSSKAKRVECIRLCREVPVSQSVSPGDRSESAATGRHTVEHWRRGHWRRQPHGAAWERENPNVSVHEDDKGRRCHMVRIEPVLVGAKPPTKESK